METAGGIEGRESGARIAATGTAATPCGNPCASCARALTCPALALTAQTREGGRA